MAIATDMPFSITEKLKTAHDRKDVLSAVLTDLWRAFNFLLKNRVIQSWQSYIHMGLIILTKNSSMLISQCSQITKSVHLRVATLIFYVPSRKVQLWILLFNIYINCMFVIEYPKLNFPIYANDITPYATTLLQVISHLETLWLVFI